MRFYRLKNQQKSLSAAHLMPHSTKKTMGKETPLSVATHNGVTIPVVYAVGKRIVEIQNELNKEAITV